MAFVPEAALIALREGLEALLIVGILLTLVTRAGRPDARKHVWGGFLAGVAASALAGWIVHRYLLEAFEEAGLGALFELVAALLAVGLLTYMAFWMWNHTRALLRESRERVEAALEDGKLLVIALLVFATVLREGLEVVLFYAALATRVSGPSLAWSGLVGFLASGVLVYALLVLSRRVDLQRFFAWTGAWLIVVAAMLLTHVVSALTDLGVLAPQPAIWNTGHVIAGGSVLGRVLHAVVGYTPAPTLHQAAAYLGFLVLVGGAYLWHVGALHRGPARRGGLHLRRVGAVAGAVLLASVLVAQGALNPVGFVDDGHHHGVGTASHDHDDASTVDQHVDASSVLLDPDEGPAIPEDVKVGVLLRAHGEPVHYNASTYWSFRNFTRDLLVMFGFEALLHEDEGTVLLDRSRPFAHEPAVDPDLVDAWLRPHDGPAAYVGSPAPDVQQVPLYDGYYKTPGGPGLGEPDVLEMAGLSAYKAWLQMENASPMYEQKGWMLATVERILEERYGDRVVVEVSRHIQPRIDPGNEGDAAALQRLRDAGVDVLVDAYTSSLHSDVMNTCMMRPHLMEAAEEVGFTAPIVHSGPKGPTATYAAAVAHEVQHRVAEAPEGAKVAVFLTHHGMDPGYESPCRDRPDPYNAQAQRMFELARAAVLNRSLDRDVRVLQVYGQGAGDADDDVLSPREALDAAKAWGATHVVDLPYELTGNGYDNLVVHRGNYGLDPAEAPHYNASYETTFTRDGMQVRILSSAFGTDQRALAQVSVILDVLDDAVERAG